MVEEFIMNDFLKRAVATGASDEHLLVGQQPFIRKNGVMKRVAETLRATVAQKLVYSSKHDRRYPVCEVKIVTSTIKDYILKSDIEEIYKLVAQNTNDGMMSLNQSLARLVKEDYITAEEALGVSNDENDLSKILRGVY